MPDFRHKKFTVMFTVSDTGEGLSADHSEIETDPQCLFLCKIKDKERLLLGNGEFNQCRDVLDQGKASVRGIRAKTAL